MNRKNCTVFRDNREAFYMRSNRDPSKLGTHKLKNTDSDKLRPVSLTAIKSTLYQQP